MECSSEQEDLLMKMREELSEQDDLLMEMREGLSEQDDLLMERQEELMMLEQEDLLTFVVELRG